MRPNEAILTGVLTACLAVAGPANAGTVSDTWSEASLTTAYTLNEQLNPLNIDVEVRNGNAMLSGTVESEVEKELAGEIAMATKGVNKVDNGLEVAPDAKTGASPLNGFARKVDDATITAKVKSQLLWNDATSGLNVNVETNEGVVTLRGEVGTEKEAQLVEQIAANTRGVESVNRAIEVNKNKSGSVAQTAQETAALAGRAVADTWITTKVKSALLYNRQVDGTAIDVSTENGVVKLEGALSSAGERSKAVEIAQGIVGVKRVEPAIRVAKTAS